MKGAKILGLVAFLGLQEIRTRLQDFSSVEDPGLSEWHIPRFEKHDQDRCLVDQSLVIHFST
jgi:hypothetical protein